MHDYARKGFADLRSVIVLKLLSLALSIATAREKATLALAIRGLVKLS